jgi:hypothetical protein
MDSGAGGSVMGSAAGFAAPQEQLSFSSEADPGVVTLFQLLVKLMIGKHTCRHHNKHAEGNRDMLIRNPFPCSPAADRHITRAHNQHMLMEMRAASDLQHRQLAALRSRPDGQGGQEDQPAKRARA